MNDLANSERAFPIGLFHAVKTADALADERDGHTYYALNALGATGVATSCSRFASATASGCSRSRRTSHPSVSPRRRRVARAFS